MRHFNNRIGFLSSLFTAWLFCIVSQAQVFEVVVPYSVKHHLGPIERFITLHDDPLLKTTAGDTARESERLKRMRFARKIEVHQSPDNSGFFEETSSGRVWRLGITSPGAASLYLVFDTFRLNSGVKLFVYNQAGTDCLGAFTTNNNNTSNVFAVAPLKGESLIIELNIPPHTNDFGRLVLTQVWHDYKNRFGDNNLKSTIYESSEGCNVDISCWQGRDWQTEKNAVVRILVYGTLCTGTLINNTGNEQVPYLITACHCVEDSAAAASAIFFFGYERPDCDKPGGEKSFSLMGSTLLATTERELDFSLLRLNEIPPAPYTPYLAGWDASGETPEKGVCIHHPVGDVKKISVENHPLINGDFGEGFNENAHWVVSKWEYGSTEGGSSGAPLFNNDHRLCGTLTGGDATCNNPVNDFFAKLSVSWDYYPEPANQLKYWLDAAGTSIKQSDGRYLHSLSENTLNAYSNSEGEVPAVYATNMTWGTLAGHNSSGYSQFAEKYYAAAPMELSGMFIGISDRYFADMYSYFTLKIWKGNEFPEKEIYSQDVYLRSLIRSASNQFLFDAPVTVADTFFVGFAVDYNMYDSLKAFTSAHRGPYGSSHMYVYNGAWNNVNKVTSPALNTSLMAGVLSASDMNPALKVQRELRITPNPCTNELRIEFSDEINPVSFRCFDITGRLFSPASETTNAGLIIEVSGLPAGIYLIVVDTKTGRLTEKFVVVR